MGLHGPVVWLANCFSGVGLQPVAGTVWPGKTPDFLCAVDRGLDVGFDGRAFFLLGEVPLGLGDGCWLRSDRCG